MAEKTDPKEPEKPAPKAAPKFYRMRENLRHGAWFEAGTKHDLAAEGISAETITNWLAADYIEEA
jgi:hypothetical protein